MKPGDRVTATWPDGHQIVGIYARSERGYVVLLDLKKNKEVACNMRTVDFKPGNQIKDDDSPERIARNIQLLVSFLWGLLLGGLGYWFATL